MKYKNFILDKFQEDAIRSIESNHSVVVSAPTGSGKTLIADYIINKHSNIIYTAPIKALSNQKYKDFCKEYGKDRIGLLTGDTVINPTAPILIMTTEIYRNMALTERSIDAKYIVFDEIHYINDIERGYIWEESIIFSDQNKRFLCLSATIPNADQFASWINSIKDHTVDVVKHDKREVPLKKMFYYTDLGITSLEDIKDIVDIPQYIKGRLYRQRTKPPSHLDLIPDVQTPCLYFVFSRKKCEDYSKALTKAKIFDTDPQISAFLRAQNLSTDIKSLKSTQLLLHCLPHGIAFHHAGMIPSLKEIVEELFANGKIKVLYTTETFAVGINMPAKSVCFDSIRKYDGVNFRYLNSKEYFQISGRAGRRGIDKKGYVYVMINQRDFNYKKIRSITDSDTEPIQSQFKLSINTVLNLIGNHTQQEIDIILTNNFYTYQHQKNIFAHNYLKIKSKLTRLGYVQDDKLTEKGYFTSRIYCDELIIGEIFGTTFYEHLNEYQYLLILACLCYESKETEFKIQYPDQMMRRLRKSIYSHDIISEDQRFTKIEAMTAMIYPCFYQKNIFDIIKNTNIPEGDLLRFFGQILDRINQIQKATPDTRLRSILGNCKDIIRTCLAEIS
ncbi:DEAD/DEAH box helicase [Candidatus Woesearchaeota archaeon]|nr:DEAD/DEAH box helicase [Candidatus Woesearchaeota archaeon]